MSKTVFELVDIMEIIGVDNSIIKSNIIDVVETKKRTKKLTYQPRFVENNLITGNLGENIANLYLCSNNIGKSVNWVSLINDSAGYDFEAGDCFYEAKATKTMGSKANFYMSANEINTCISKKGKYKILYIQIDIRGDIISNDSILLYELKDFYIVLLEFVEKTSFNGKESLGGGLVSVKTDSVNIEVDMSMLTLIEHEFTTEEIEQLQALLENKKNK